MSDYFHNARDFRILDGNFSHAGRDQTNIRTIKRAVFHVEGTSQAKEVDVESETLELSEFHEVKRGDIRIIEEVARHAAKNRRLYYDQDERRIKERTGDLDHIIYTAELNVIGSLVSGSKFTVKTYYGPYALQDWREEFSRCSQIVQTGVFGYNRSKIPSLIVSGELVPAAHILDTASGAGGGVLKDIYIYELLKQLGCCRPNEVWMDPSRGVLCRGPVGPECEVDIRFVKRFEELPLDAGLLKEDVFIRFAASVKSWSIDRLLVLRLARKSCNEVSTHRVDRPTVITPSNTPIAVGAQRWNAYSSVCLDGRQELENGTMRLALGERGTKVSLDSYLWGDDQKGAWLAQSLSILQSCGISADEDLSQYKLIIPDCVLKGRLLKPQERRPEPIYFFISPSTPLLSCTTGDVHYWSLDPDGQSPLDPDTCHRLGLPTELELTVNHYADSWSSDVYQVIRKYQVARGFDPSTPDFAHYLGYPIYPPAHNDLNRFKEVGENVKTSSLWSKMNSLFSPTVSDDSDILTVGF